MIIVSFQLIVAVISRLFQTAVVASLSSDEEQGASIGYLFGDVKEDKEPGKYDTVKPVKTVTLKKNKIGFQG